MPRFGSATAQAAAPTGRRQEWPPHQEEPIARDADLTSNEAGGGAARKAVEAAEGTPVVLHALARLTGAHTDERAWRVGAKGERRTGKALEKLARRGWTILHDVTIGPRGANIDHVAIGPAGVYVVDAKYTRSKVHVWKHTLKFGGYKTHHLAAIRRQRTIAVDRLSNAVGFDVPVGGVISIVTHVNGSPMKVHAKVVDADVVHVEGLHRLLKSKPRNPELSDRQLEAIKKAACDPDTWLPGAHRSSDSDAVVEADAHDEVDEPTDDGDVGLTRWRKFGHDRVYANSPAGQPLGWIDLATGEIREVPDDRDDVEDTLNAVRDQLRSEGLPPEPSSRVPGPAREADPPTPQMLDSHGGDAEIITAEWRRYGKHRIYANSPDNERLGWIDVTTGETKLEADVDAAAVTQRLVAAREALTAGADKTMSVESKLT